MGYNGEKVVSDVLRLTQSTDLSMYKQLWDHMKLYLLKIARSENEFPMYWGAMECSM